MKYFAALISIILGSGAQYFFKVGVTQIKNSDHFILLDILKNIPLLGGLFCYAVSVLIWFYVLSQMELSRAYPLVSIGYVFTLFLGYFLLGEALTWTKIIGICVIIIGVIIISQ